MAKCEADLLTDVQKLITDGEALLAAPSWTAAAAFGKDVFQVITDIRGGLVPPPAPSGECCVHCAGLGVRGLLDRLKVEVAFPNINWGNVLQILIQIAQVIIPIFLKPTPTPAVA